MLVSTLFDMKTQTWSPVSINFYFFFAPAKLKGNQIQISKLKENNDKVHIFWEGHQILRNLHQSFVLCIASQIISGDFAKFCGLLRIYELYKLQEEINVSVNPRYDAIFFGNPGWIQILERFAEICVLFSQPNPRKILLHSLGL